MNGSIYVAPLAGISVANTYTGNIAVITAPSTGILEILRVEVGQVGLTASERIAMEFRRTTTAPTGGRTVTARPSMEDYAAFGGTVLDHGTVFTADGTLGDQLHQFGIDVLAGLLWHATPEDEIIVAPSGRFALRLLDTFSATTELNGSITFRYKGN